MTSYELSRNWFDWCFENPEKINPNHSALYFFAIEHCNRLGWKEKFGMPSQMAMEAIGIKNWRTYSKVLNELIEFGFIKLIEKSKNQYSSNIIAIVENTKANTKALDKALQKHSTKQGQSIVSIDKQYNNITYNKKLLSELLATDVPNELYFNVTKKFYELFLKNQKELGAKTTTLEKAKGSWYDEIKKIFEIDKYTKEDLLLVYEFLKVNDFWKPNILSTSKLREKFDKLIIEAKNKGIKLKTIPPKPQGDYTLNKYTNEWIHTPYNPRVDLTSEVHNPLLRNPNAK